MKKVLISNIYDHSSIMLCIKKFSIDDLYLVVDKEENSVQQKALEMIKETWSKVIKIHIKKSKVYDIMGTAKVTVSILDEISDDSLVYVNVTSGRKTQSMGLVFGSYARIGKVDSIVYVTEEEKDVIYLPKVEYPVTETQREMLDLISQGTMKNVNLLSEHLNVSKGMAYRNYETLKKKGMIKLTSRGIELTDYGNLILL